MRYKRCKMNKIEKTDSLKTILSKRRFTVDVFQREYRWGRKQIEQMLSDLQGTFEEYYNRENHDSTSEVEKYGHYYMGCIICTGGSPTKIIDGQQRLTSLTLLLIYINNLQKIQALRGFRSVNFEDMIFYDHYGKRAFNIDVEERKSCFEALMSHDTSYQPENESTQNMVDRYNDIEELFPDELKEETLEFFIYWLIEKVLLLEIDTPSEDEAHTIFLTMNDRGLSLNSAEMMKAYVIQQIAEEDRADVNHKWQDIINQIKNASSYDSSGNVNTEDVEFISTWLRAKYAETLREGKRGAIDEDFELLGEKFHTWVRNNAKSKMNLKKSGDYKSLVIDEMFKVANLYLKIKLYGTKLTNAFEEVFYNNNRDLNYQTMLIISAVRNDDSEDIISRKIQMVSKFVDDFASVRIFNFKKVNWNTNKYQLFRIMKEIRNQDSKTIGMILVRALRRMEVSIDAITRFNLNQFSGRYMLHMLARFTSYVNVKMGNTSMFDVYVDRKSKGNTYDVEHILPNDFKSYSSEFLSADDFEKCRQMLGNLIILTKDKNRSYQAMKYEEKVKKYVGDNILAQALNDTAYHNNPQFKKVANEYGFEPIPLFKKDSLNKRAMIYLKMAADIWDPNNIKNISGGWDEAEEKAFFKNDKPQEFTVEYADRSWPDALKYGFLSANIGGTGKYLQNIQEGDIVYCHIASSGFVGIGQCLATAKPMKDFTVQVNGEERKIADIEWQEPECKNRLDKNNEIFIRVKWERFKENQKDGIWETGMVTVPMVAYKLSEPNTYKRVRELFG